MPSTSGFNLDRHQEGSAQTLDALHPLPLPTWFHQAEQDIASLLVHHRQSAAAATAAGRSILLHHPTASYFLPSTMRAVYAVSNDSHNHRSHNQSHAVSCHDLYHPGFAAIQQVYRLLSALDRFNTSLTEHFFHSRFGIQRSCLYQLLHLSSVRPRPSVALPSPSPSPSDNRSLHIQPGHVQPDTSAALAAITTTANIAQGQDTGIDTTDEPLPQPPKAPLVKGASRRGNPPPSSTWAVFACSASRYPQVVLPPPVPIPGPYSFAANENHSLSPMALSPRPSSSASHI